MSKFVGSGKYNLKTQHLFSSLSEICKVCGKELGAHYNDKCPKPKKKKI